LVEDLQIFSRQKCRGDSIVVSDEISKKNNNEQMYISHHILPTAANLLGLCFVILSFMKISRLGLETIIDELVATAIVVFLIACFFSYASIRSSKLDDYYEKVADSIFMLGLLLLTIAALVIVFEIV
jgi:hypothetical protein